MSREGFPQWPPEPTAPQPPRRPLWRRALTWAWGAWNLVALGVGTYTIGSWMVDRAVEAWGEPSTTYQIELQHPDGDGPGDPFSPTEIERRRRAERNNHT